MCADAGHVGDTWALRVVAAMGIPCAVGDIVAVSLELLKGAYVIVPMISWEGEMLLVEGGSIPLGEVIRSLPDGTCKRRLVHLGIG